MKIAGIIAEYNPFHNGHLFHLQETKKKTGADGIVIVMSGNFVQRGDVAITQKHRRALAAVSHGADLVLEVPCCYATQSAEIFAKGTVGLLNQLGSIDYLSFGSECGEIDQLYEEAQVLRNNSPDYKMYLKKELNKGLSYASASAKAMENIYSISRSNQSNDILAVEYMKQLLMLKSEIQPLPILRKGASYGEKKLIGEYASATSIRLNIHDIGKAKMDTFIPQNSLKLMLEDKAQHRLMNIEQFFSEIKLLILRNKHEMTSVFGINEGIENLLYKNALASKSIEEILQHTKSKRYAYTRLRRILINLLINITKDDMKFIVSSPKIPYGRVLAFNDTGRKLLKNFNSQDFSLIIKESNFKPRTELELRAYAIDHRANAIYYSKYQDGKSLDLMRSPIYFRTIQNPIS